MVVFVIVIIIVCALIYHFLKDTLVEDKEPFVTLKKNFEANKLCSSSKKKKFELNHGFFI